MPDKHIHNMANEYGTRTKVVNLKQDVNNTLKKEQVVFPCDVVAIIGIDFCTSAAAGLIVTINCTYDNVDGSVGSPYPQGAFAVYRKMGGQSAEESVQKNLYGVVINKRFWVSLQSAGVAEQSVCSLIIYYRKVD